MMWVAEVLGYTPKFDVVFTNEPLTRRLFVEAGYKVEPIPFYKREIYSATEIRQRMLKNKNWEELVPESTVQFINEIGGVERIRELAKTDKIKS
jgi:nicotinamide-nucleotide adenylyltransferase